MNAISIGRSLSGRRWVWREGEDAAAALGIAQRLGVPEIVGRLLTSRGIGIDAAEAFLEPTLRALLPDPSVLADMDAAADRLAHAAETGETVGVLGDYDVDGACSAAVMALLLGALGCQVLTHIPDRIQEGYGPNAVALQSLVRQGARLVVCVDCGTTAAAALSSIAGLADIVVLDHHACHGDPPPVLATVNPNRGDCRSGLGGLCAAGVAFMAAIATVRVLRGRGFLANRPEPDLLGLLDLVALATVCDVMPLTGVNRALVAQGLKVMGRRARPGIAALLDVALSRDAPNTFTCGFALGPRINAGGRIGEADLGLRLLLCDDPVEAGMIAATLDAINRQRQVMEAAVLDHAMEAAQRQLADGHAVVLACGSDWHPGVVGIVAGKMKEKLNRPVCVAALADGLAKGSGRSIAGLDLGAVILAARGAGLLTAGGGHAMAAGFSFEEGKIAAFHAFLDEHLAAARDLPQAADLAIEGGLSVAGATVDLATAVHRLAPFGPGNPEPVFVVGPAHVAHCETMGREGNTIRAILAGEGEGRLKALLFRAKDSPLANALLDRSGRPMRLAGWLRAETWQGRMSAALIVSDIAVL